MLGEMLQMFGHTVFVENHPIAALDRATEIQADVHLLDIGLPEIDGYELARRLRAKPELTPSLVALTGYGQPEDLQKSLCGGVQLPLCEAHRHGKLKFNLGRIKSTASWIPATRASYVLKSQPRAAKRRSTKDAVLCL